MAGQPFVDGWAATISEKTRWLESQNICTRLHGWMAGQPVSVYEPILGGALCASAADLGSSTHSW